MYLGVAIRASVLGCLLRHPSAPTGLHTRRSTRSRNRILLLVSSPTGTILDQYFNAASDGAGDAL